MVRKVTEKLRNKLVKARKEGMTYNQIIEKFDVGKWICINYLKDIKVDESYIQKKWTQAERDAEKFLLKKGFTNILNLNNICNAPYWDYYAEKNGRWLIDVTINEKKSIINKYSRLMEGFNCCILYQREDETWDLTKIETKKI